MLSAIYSTYVFKGLIGLHLNFHTTQMEPFLCDVFYSSVVSM